MSLTASSEVICKPLLAYQVVRCDAILQLATRTVTHWGDTTLMTKSELIDRLAAKQEHLQLRDVEASVRLILDEMMNVLSQGGRVEIRGFGSFCLHFRKPRVGRNPKTGEAVVLDGKYVPHFKPGKELRERVNKNARIS